MPRPRVKDEDRKRVARACDTCKRRKEKCDGNQPCLLCRRRNREGECVFTEGRFRASVSSTTSAPLSELYKTSSLQTNGDGVIDPVFRDNRERPETPSRNFDLRNSFASNTDAEIAIESLLTLSGGGSGNRSAAKTPINGPPQTNPGILPHAPVPKLARLLRDGHGKFIFVGDSSNLAFLQNIRRLVKSAIGHCGLTTDPLRHAMVEAHPEPIRRSDAEIQNVLKPDVSEAKELVNFYLLASSGVLDLFDPEIITHDLCAWAKDPSIEIETEFNSSIFYLVMAIGAQVRAVGHEEQAEIYFSRGRALVVSSFMDDPSVQTIQSYALIAMYMLTTCRRNGAFMLMGIAVRAAYALGLHRSDISNSTLR